MIKFLTTLTHDLKENEGGTDEVLNSLGYRNKSWNEDKEKSKKSANLKTKKSEKLLLA